MPECQCMSAEFIHCILDWTKTLSGMILLVSKEIYGVDKIRSQACNPQHATDISIYMKTKQIE